MTKPQPATEEPSNPMMDLSPLQEHKDSDDNGKNYGIGASEEIHTNAMEVEANTGLSVPENDVKPSDVKIGRTKRAVKKPERIEMTLKSKSKKPKSKGKKGVGGKAKKSGRGCAGKSQNDSQLEGERRSSRESAVNTKALSFAEADSDDEFARENFMFSSDSDSDTEKGNKDIERKNKNESNKKIMTDDDDFTEDTELLLNNGGALVHTSDSESDNKNKTCHSDDADDFEYRIQYILGSQTLSPEDWRKILQPMQTREVTRGSVWQMTDDEFHATDSTPVERLLIKWTHASYLHVSWETERDLLDMVGSTAKTAISRFRQRELIGHMVFDDLARGEYFLPEYIQVDRVLDIEDETIDVLNVSEKAVYPSLEDMTDMTEGECSIENGWLHGPEGWLTIKWEGLPYSGMSFDVM